MILKGAAAWLLVLALAGPSLVSAICELSCASVHAAVPETSSAASAPACHEPHHESAADESLTPGAQACHESLEAPGPLVPSTGSAATQLLLPLIAVVTPAADASRPVANRPAPRQRPPDRTPSLIPLRI